MVTLHENPGSAMLVVQPNRSASWRLNKLVILAFAVWWTLVAGFFVAIGLWPIAPFAGLEVGGLAFGLYYVCWKLQQRHVVSFDGDDLIVQKGTYYPRFTWRFARCAVSLSVELQAHPWDAPKIFLCNRHQQIPIGNFLNKDDSKKLLTLLRAQGLSVRNYSAGGRLDF